jgi:predicted transcriptional regulator
MGKHRTRLKILANILSVINSNNGAKKTQIMYQAYLSYSLLIRYLNDVTNAGLVKGVDENCYELTPKGVDFLAKFIEYTESRNNIDEQLNHIENQKSVLEEMCYNINATSSEKNAMQKKNK